MAAAMFTSISLNLEDKEQEAIEEYKAALKLPRKKKKKAKKEAILKYNLIKYNPFNF